MLHCTEATLPIASREQKKGPSQSPSWIFVLDTIKNESDVTKMNIFNEIQNPNLKTSTKVSKATLRLMMKPTVVALLCLVARSSLALVAPFRVSPPSVSPINQRGLPLRSIASDSDERDTPAARFFGVVAMAAILALSNPLEARADLFNGTHLQKRNPTGIELPSFSPKRCLR
jgi:hypothetical protein